MVLENRGKTLSVFRMHPVCCESCEVTVSVM